MKSEHRHQLETNDLSARLAQWIEKLKPYSGQITTGILLLAVGYAGLSVWNAQSKLKEDAAWDAFALATDSSDPEMNSLLRVAENKEYAGTGMQEWAYAGWADRQVLNAMQYSLADRSKMDEKLTSVLGIYEQLAKNANDPQVLNRARFGLACVYELQGKLEEAREQYALVRGDLQLQASERAKQLESASVQAATEWLAKAELPKLDLTGGQGASGARPDFEASLPETGPARSGISNESLDELLENFRSNEPADNRYGEKDDAPAEESADEESPAEDSPSDEEPADEKPATGDTEASQE